MEDEMEDEIEDEMEEGLGLTIEDKGLESKPLNYSTC